MTIENAAHNGEAFIWFWFRITKITVRLCNLFEN